MDLLTRILECKTDEEIDTIITEEIAKIQNNTPAIKQLGFLEYGKSTNFYKGFIPFKTRIKYSSMNIETYGMESTDFFYEFAYFIRKCGIKNKSQLVNSIEYFINKYFGYSGQNDRESIFNDNAWNSTTTDEEYFAALENNTIGDLKGKGAAECTERGALAQQLLSMFGTEVYYCIGCVDLGDKQEAHCFNIVKRKEDYALLDYSIPVGVYNLDGSLKVYYPFVGKISEKEFLDFVNNGTIKVFNDYEYHGTEVKYLNSERQYIVGSYSIKKEQSK